MPPFVVTTLALALQHTDIPLPTQPVAIVPTPRSSFGGAACGTSQEGEIIVCGHRDTERYRLRPLPPLADQRSLLARPMDVKIGPIHWHGLSATMEF